MVLKPACSCLRTFGVEACTAHVSEAEGREAGVVGWGCGVVDELARSVVVVLVRVEDETGDVAGGSGGG